MENQKIVNGKIIFTSKPRLTLISKVILTVTVLVLYAMQILVFLPMYGILHEKDFGDFNFPAIFILLGISLVLGITALILAIIGAVKNESPVTLITIVLKAVMIPFFGINLYLWIVGISGMLNPFLLLGIPAVGFIGFCLTYVYMMMTSAPDILYTIIFCIKNKRRPDVYMVIGVICEFFFLVDIVGAVMLHKSLKKAIVSG